MDIKTNLYFIVIYDYVNYREQVSREIEIAQDIFVRFKFIFQYFLNSLIIVIILFVFFVNNFLRPIRRRL